MFSKITCSVLALTIVGCLAASPAVADEEEVVALFKLKGPLPEAPAAVGLGPLLGEKEQLSMISLLKKLREARSDSNVQAVIFDIEESALGFAQTQELRAQFEALRAADKDVWVFCETLGNRTLMLGSAASNLVLMPTGEIIISGLYAEGAYFKGMMDKIGLEADILHCGDYKSAGEPFYRTGPSKYAEEQTNELFDALFEEMIKAVAASRKLSEDDVRGLIDRGMLSAQEALEAKLVDKLQYREDFIKSIKRRYGDDVKVVRDYGQKDGPEIDFGNPFAIFQVFSDMMKSKEKSEEAAIAVVFVEGVITSGKSEPSLFRGSSNAGSATIRKAIAEATADDSIKALVLRVDSPGGSAFASDVICEATKRFKESGRPFIVSMGNVAGSGGYYVATLGDTIYAEPTTLTGSIGVVSGKIITKGLFDWAGMSFHEYKRGKFADVWNTNRRYNDDERALLRTFMDRVYDDFKNRVLEGRKDRIKGELEPLAGGRVYAGSRALEIGLVDQLGGFAEAMKHAADEADLGGKYEVRIFPRPKSFFDLLGEAFGGEKEDDEFTIAKLAQPKVGSKFATLPPVAAGLDALRSIDPGKAKALQNFLIQMELFSDERVLMVDTGLSTLCN